jgi:hypothetical protein
MKPVLFVVCFTLGVTLMVFSGYLPQSANARGSAPDGQAAIGNTETDRSPPGLTVTRRVLSRPEEGALPADPVVFTANTPATGLPADAGPSDASDGVATPATQQPEPVAKELAPGSTPGLAGPAPTTSSDKPPVDAADVPLVADAGPDRMVWTGWDELPLDGSASSGRELAYRWRQVGGSKALTIGNDTLAVTAARGLLDDGRPGWRNLVYEFELAVTDAAGAEDVDHVKYLVCAAPPVKIKPTPERRFELRNGYQLAHFVSWVTNLETFESLFEIASPAELTLTKVAGDACEVTGGKVDGAYLYQVVVYGQVGTASSWVEFLVDTEDNIPAIVQLGVNWEAR